MNPRAGIGAASLMVALSVSPALAEKPNQQFVTQAFVSSGDFEARHIEDRQQVSIIELVGNYDKDKSDGEPNVEPRSVVRRATMESFSEQAKEGKRRKDLERKLGYTNNESYQIKDDYDAAPITGIGRSTCVTKTAEGCRVGRDPRLDKIGRALDELYPKDVEKNLERLFENQASNWNPFAKKEESPIAERRSYPKGRSKPYVILQEDHEKQIREDKEALKREQAEREKAWQEPKNPNENPPKKINDEEQK